MNDRRTFIGRVAAAFDWTPTSSPGLTVFRRTNVPMIDRLSQHQVTITWDGDKIVKAYFGAAYKDASTDLPEAIDVMNHLEKFGRPV